MRVYKVYVNPRDVRAENAVFVAQCFSWGAFFFGFLWALFKRLWIVAIITFGLVVGLALLPEPWPLAVGLVVSFVLASFAPELQGWSLRRRGLIERGQSVGANCDEAEVRFYNQPEAEMTVVVAPLQRVSERGLDSEQLTGGLA